MPLKFRNIDATPDSPVQEWGFEGMLAAIDRGYARDWRKLADAVVADPGLRETFDEAKDAAQSRSTVAVLDLLLEHAERTASEEALDRLIDAYRGTRMTQAQLAARLGTSRTRLNSYLTGRVTPSMDTLVAIERIAAHVREPAWSHNLVILD
ncbi:MAG: helix-turn-helix domain-containing protein [Acidipropionibacterium sp.]|jgi:DNA-binding XRE family transcriptional regulator|nr:helix-turn-helix domain-containing protein [Acidipropionibacterium sp.]